VFLGQTISLADKSVCLLMIHFPGISCDALVMTCISLVMHLAGEIEALFNSPIRRFHTVAETDSLGSFAASQLYSVWNSAKFGSQPDRSMPRWHSLFGMMQGLVEANSVNASSCFLSCSLQRR
jgi:hypothetical protein